MVVTEDTPGAKRRDWVSPDKKNSGTKWEKHYEKIDGMITGIEFYDGDYGKNLIITIVDGEDAFAISIKTLSDYAEDLMKKIPSIDLSKKVTLAPYAFVDEKTKSPRKGITVVQDDKKVQKFFYDFHEKKSINGYPEYVHKVDKKTGERKEVSKPEWKIFFAQCNVWLVEYITEHHLIDSRKAERDENWKVDQTLNEMYPTDEGLPEVAF
jgi:hypothetical protein